MANTLYERLGGKPALDAAVECLYQKTINDDRISHFCSPTDITKQARKMHAFLSYAFGAHTPFNGSSLQQAHEKLVENGLNDGHFDAVKEHIESTLRQLEVAPELINEVLEITESTREDVLNRTNG